MSHFDGKNWTRVETEDGRTIIRVYEGVYVGPDVDAAETYIQDGDVWTQDGEPVEDVTLVDDLDTLVAPVDQALVAESAPVEPLTSDPVEEVHDHEHGDETHVH